MIPEYDSREKSMLTKFLQEVNNVRRQRNVQEIPKDVFDIFFDKIRTGNDLLTCLTR